MSQKLKSVASSSGETYNSVQNYFFDYPTREFSLNELSSALRVSKITANRTVARLVKEDFLKKQVIGRVWRISCNQTHSYNTARKIPYHLCLVYNSEIIEAVHEKVSNARTIILFGSYRKGDDKEDSDIDIAVEVISNDEHKIIELGVIPQLGYRQNVKVNLHIFSRNKVDFNLFANIANGIVLEGFLEVRP